MRNRNIPGSGLLKKSVIAAITISTLGCGGGGGGTTAAVPSGSTGTTTTVTVQPQTFNFPTFTNNSKLAVVANFQTAQEAPLNLTGQLVADLADLSGAVPRVALRSDPSSDDTPDINPCGYSDACALNHLIGNDVNAQSTESTAVRKRFQELAEGAQEDFFLLPGGE